MKGDLSPFKRAQARDKSEFVHISLRLLPPTDNLPPPAPIFFRLRLHTMGFGTEGMACRTAVRCATPRGTA